jgi:methyl-accepting chemotaxis protein
MPILGKAPSVRTRTLLAPVIGLLSTIIIVSGIWVSALIQAQTTQKAEAAAEASRAMQELLLQVMRQHAALVRTVSWQSAHMEAAKIAASKALYTKIGQEIENGLRQASALPAAPPADLLAQAEAARAAYAKEGAQVLDYLDIDIALAAMGEVTTDRLHETLQERVRQLAEDAEQRRVRVDSEGKSETRAVLADTLAMVVACALAALAIGIVSALSIARPLLRLTEAMKRLAGGERATDIPALERADEIGSMAAAVKVFKDGLITADRLSAEQQRDTAAREARAASIQTLTARFDGEASRSIASLSLAADQLRQTANSMSEVAEQTSGRATAVAAASQESSSSVDTVAAAAEELAESIAEISRHVTESTKISSDAVDKAAETDSLVEGLLDSTQKIGHVVRLINDIAAKTNLLALNATIEAAQAGAAGKGFAVVAGEVKSLANQTSHATEEITAQIAEVQQATQHSVEAIRGITGIIGRVGEIANAIASAVEEQRAATAEIAHNAALAATGTREVARHIQGLTDGAQRADQASHSLQGEADGLANQARFMREKVESFLADVGAA